MHILGIDAAWTDKNPSGLALVSKTHSGWHLTAATGSYTSFHKRAFGTDYSGFTSLPDAATLLSAAQAITEEPVALVAIDMPMARSPIIGRRHSDNEVSRYYGSRYCSTHSPSAVRPGPISDNLRKGFSEIGYALCTQTIFKPGVIEVYPHPALVELSGDTQRLPYKAGNISKYWKDYRPERRRYELFKTWLKIENLLEREISGVIKALPKLDMKSSVKELKAYEDTLDAIVCAWVGICALEGGANPIHSF